MKKFFYVLFSVGVLLSFLGCGIYSFSGISLSSDVKTFEVRPFVNEAAIVIPSFDRQLTTTLQDFILNQTNLSLTTNKGDIVYEGEIINYFVSPNTATADQTAAENRLTVAVRMRYIDTTNEKNDLERTFSFFFDFPGAAQLSGAVEEEAHEIIIERLTQDMVNETLARW